MPFLRPRFAPLAVILFAAAPLPLAAQLPPLTAPKGLFRLELGGRLDNWDKMFFEGAKRDAAADFVRDPIDGSWLPVLTETEQRLRALTGVQASLALSLGKTSAHELVNVGTESIGAAYGLTRRLTLFGTIPIVRVRVQAVVSLDSTGATAGFNPAHPSFGSSAGASEVSEFLNQLAAALTTLSDELAAGSFDNDLAKKALAEATLARGTALQNGLQEFYGTAIFLPLAGTAGATAVNGSVDSLRSRLVTDFNIPFAAAPVFPTIGLPPEGLESFATSPDGPIQAQPFEPPILRGIGDVEIGAAYLWLDHRPASGGLAVRSALQGTVRLRTAKLGRPDGLFDLPTGDRQPDMQGDLVTDVGAGRIGARITARYVLQLPARQERRLTPPDQPLAPATTLAEVERDPGEIVEAALEPYVRIASHFSIVGGIRHWKKGIDKYSYTPNQAPIAGTTPAVLALGSKTDGTVLSAALSFVHDGLRRDGTAGIPIDAILRGELVVGSGQGRVPVKQSISLVLRLYRRIF
ncbi:MAG TPA: hypothetical protein VGQ69_00945 [Gemmatimonadales bacterium]|nr:hypothetical protein [Gemmatimonadales bacterium]